MIVNSYYKLSLIGLSLLFLGGCSTNNSSTSLPSSNESTALTNLSSSSLSDSSTSFSQVDSIKEYIHQLQKLTDHPNETTVRMTNSYNYKTDGDPLTISGTDDFSIKRYSSKETGITIRKGTVLLSSTSKYEMQTFHDKNLFYKLTAYEDNSDSNVKEEIKYTGDEEANLSINYSYSVIKNLQYLSSIIENNSDSQKGAFSLSPIKEGLNTISYSITQYKDSVIELFINHEDTFTVKDSVIVSSTSNYEYDAYAGGEKTNWQTVVTKSNYTHGEYEVFTGTLFNPKDFETSK